MFINFCLQQFKLVMLAIMLGCHLYSDFHPPLERIRCLVVLTSSPLSAPDLDACHASIME